MADLKSQEALTHFDNRSFDWNQLYQRPQFLDRLSLFLDETRKHVAPGSRILDFGCGTGLIAMELAALGYQVTGVDGSRGMIEKAQAEMMNRELSLISFEAIDPSTWRPELQFDAIVCSSVLEYVPDDEALLKLFAQILAPKGTLLISVPYKYSLVGIIKDAVHSWRSRKNDQLHDIQFAQRRYTRTSFANTLKKAGFEAPRWTSFEVPGGNKLGVLMSRVPLIGVMMLANTRRL